MTVFELHDNIEIQSEIAYCYYDYENERRIVIGYEEAREHEVRYMYIENNTLFIEIEKE